MQIIQHRYTFLTEPSFMKIDRQIINMFWTSKLTFITFTIHKMPIFYMDTISLHVDLSVGFL